MVQALLKDVLTMPLRLLVCGKSGSGKSNLIQKKIIPAIGKHFHQILVFSPTILVQSQWQKIRQLNKKVVLDLDISASHLKDVLQGIKQEVSAPKGRQKKFLVILDDVTQLLLTNAPIVVEFITTARHYNVSYVLASHKFKAVPPLVRANLDMFIFFQVTTNTEKIAIAGEFSDPTFFNSDIMMRNMLDTCAKGYNALVVVQKPTLQAYYCLQSKNSELQLIYPIDDILIELMTENPENHFTKQDLRHITESGEKVGVIFATSLDEKYLLK
jgi:hypothetical protein